MLETQLVRRGHTFIPTTSTEFPALYATENVVTADKVIQAHYFIGSADWWIVEYSPAEGIAYGYCSLYNPEDAEWGNISLEELETLNVRRNVVERDLLWVPTLASECLPLKAWKQPDTLG